MKVSIITTTFNSAKTINDTIQSVLKQTYPIIEHVFIDGKSTDNTLEIIQKNNPNARIVSEKDNGIYDAMNKGLKTVNGDIIGILNSDDFYSDNLVIEEVVKVFNQTNCDTVYGDLVYVDAINTSLVKRKWVAGPFSAKSFLYGWMPPHPTFFVKKEIYDKFGMFNLELWGAADYELMLRLLFKNKVSVGYLPKTLVNMRSGGQSNSKVSNRVRANMEDRKAWKINSLQPKWFTLYLKPLRKIKQFIV